MEQKIDKRVSLSYEDAIKMLPEGDTIHTFRNVPGVLIGADWNRESILSIMKEFEKTIKLSGKAATATNHGIALIDEGGLLFIETKK